MSEITIEAQLALPSLKSAKALYEALSDDDSENAVTVHLRSLVESGGGDFDELRLARRMVSFIIVGSTALPVEDVVTFLQELGAKSLLIEVLDDQSGEEQVIAMHNDKTCAAAQAKRYMTQASSVPAARTTKTKRKVASKPRPIPEPTIVDLDDYPPGGYMLPPDWKSIEKTLRAFARSPYVYGFKSADIALHRQLYDRVQEECPVTWPDGAIVEENDYKGDFSLLNKQYLLWLWYHPNPDVIDMGCLQDYVDGIGSGAWNALFDDYPKAVWDTRPLKLMPGYGMMGGREKLIVPLICPEREYPLDRTDGRTPGVGTFAAAFCKSAWCELANDFMHYPFDPRQYAFDRFVDACDYLPNVLSPKGAAGWSGEGLRKSLLLTLKMIQRFDEHTGPSRWRPSTIELVTHVRRACEAPGAPGQLQDLWAQALEMTLEERRKGVPAQRDPKERLASMGREKPELSDEDLERIYASWPQVRH